MFIVIEGLDGTGKSTLARSLAQHLGAIHLRTPDESLASVRPILDAMLSETPSACAQRCRDVSFGERTSAPGGTMQPLFRLWSGRVIGEGSATAFTPTPMTCGTLKAMPG